MEAPQEANIAFNYGASFLLTLPKLRLAHFSLEDLTLEMLDAENHSVKNKNHPSQLASSNSCRRSRN